MKVLQGRRGIQLQAPLRILSMLRGQWDEQRAPALQALADLGHEVVYLDEVLPLDGYRKVTQRLQFDVAILWGSSLQNLLMSSSEPFFLDEMGLPYVSLWTDNPVKHLFLLKDVMTPLHRAMFVADTRVIEQLDGLGIKELFYLPPWHMDPEIFRPVASEPDLGCDVGFAGTVYSYQAERRKWRAFWDYRMNGAADGIVDQLRQSRWHVDAFDALSNEWDVYGLPFSLISHAMYFEQKAIHRELLVDAMEGREIHIVGIGTAQSESPSVIMHAGMEWHELSRFFCSARINLNCTPWPRSCHHRLFQAAASGAFMISDHCEDSPALFEPDKEMVYFHSFDELPELIDRYLAHPEEARAIADAGRRRFLAHHTAEKRMAEFSRILGELI